MLLFHLSNGANRLLLFGLNELKVANTFNNAWFLIIIFKVLYIEIAHYPLQYPLSPSSMVTEFLILGWEQPPRIKTVFIHLSCSSLWLTSETQQY